MTNHYPAFAATANDDGVPDDGTAGQSHRKRMVENLRTAPSPHKQGAPKRGGHSGRGGRGGGFAGFAPHSGRGGRGGGFAGRETRSGRGGRGRGLAGFGGRDSHSTRGNAGKSPRRRRRRKVVVKGQELPKANPGVKNACRYSAGKPGRSAGQDEQLAHLFSSMKLGDKRSESPKSRMTRAKTPKSGQKKKTKAKVKSGVGSRALVGAPSRLMGAESFVESFQKSSGLGNKPESQAIQGPGLIGSTHAPALSEPTAIDVLENVSLAPTAPPGKGFDKEVPIDASKDVNPVETTVAAPSDGFAPRPAPASLSNFTSSSMVSSGSSSGFDLGPAIPETREVVKSPTGSTCKYSTIQDIAANVNRQHKATRSGSGFGSSSPLIALTSGFASPIGTPDRVAATTNLGIGSSSVVASKSSGAVPDLVTSINPFSSTPKDVKDSAKSDARPSSVAANTGSGLSSPSDIAAKTIKSGQGLAFSKYAPSGATKTAAAHVEHQTVPQEQKKSSHSVHSGLSLLQKAAKVEGIAKEASKIRVSPSAFTSGHVQSSAKSTPGFHDHTSVIAPFHDSALAQTTSATDSMAPNFDRSRYSSLPFQKQQKSTRPVPAGLAFLNATAEDKMDAEKPSETRGSGFGMGVAHGMKDASVQTIPEIRGPLPGFVPAVANAPAKANATVPNFSAINKSLVQSTSASSRRARPAVGPGLNASLHNPGNPINQRPRISHSTRPVPAGFKFIAAVNAEYDSEKVAKETSKLPDLVEPRANANTSGNFSSHFRTPHRQWPVAKPGESWDDVEARVKRELGCDEDVEMDDDEEL